MADSERTVLIVDGDDGFVDDTRKLLDDAKVYTARNISDAQRRLVEESIDLAFIGPSYSHESGVAESSLLLDVRPELPLVLVSQSLDTAVLKAALRAGFRDVVEAPLTVRKVSDALGIVDKLDHR
ncbi:MAG: hypothetical protein KJO84_04985, partial [Acidimicrobiia bacterium]|nr:hypothetical protein [Acidimicrobiia bacterium]